MAGILKRAALAFGRLTGFRKEQSQPTDAITEPVTAGESIDPVSQAVDEAIEAMDTTPAMETPWEPELSHPIHSESETSISADPTQQSELVLSPIPEQPEQPVGFIAEPCAVTTTPAPIVEEIEERHAPELKPGKPSISFTQLYELISTEVNKRNESSIAVYERLLAATREELESTRKGSRVAWSVGGVMTAVATFGGVWAATEMGATRSEISALKHQMTSSQQISMERDKLQADALRIKEAGAQVQIDALKARLDQALTVSAERDRLRGELETVTKAKLTVEQELRLARAIATTQPVSDARRASEAYKGAVGAERADVWSVLLNGRD